MVDEVLYYRAINNGSYRNLRLPGMDVNETTYTPIFKAIRKMYGTFAAINSENGRIRVHSSKTAPGQSAGTAISVRACR